MKDSQNDEKTVSSEKSYTADAKNGEQAAARARINRLSRLMDTAIRLPGGYRIGWDGIIGLVPGIGDIAGMLVSLYIVAGAKKSGASGATVVRMLLNVGIEALVGAVPIVGDLFDMAFKANMRNMKILNRQFDQPTSVERESKQNLWFTGILVVGLFVLAGYIVIRVLAALVRWIF